MPYPGNPVCPYCLQGAPCPKHAGPTETEILRIVKLPNGDHRVSFDRTAFPEPGHWGVVLADAIRDIAKGCAPVGALRHDEPLTEPQEVAIRRVLDLLASEVGPYLPKETD